MVTSNSIERWERLATEYDLEAEQFELGGEKSLASKARAYARTSRINAHKERAKLQEKQDKEPK